MRVTENFKKQCDTDHTSEDKGKRRPNVIPLIPLQQNDNTFETPLYG